MTNQIKLWLYPGANPNSDPTNWEPYVQDITAYVRRPGDDGGAPINYQGGRQDESSQTDAGQMTLTLDNRDGRFSTENIAGPWYGLIDLNTPIRLGVYGAADNFNRTVSGSWGTSSDGSGTWSGTVSTWSVASGIGQTQIANANNATVTTLPNADARDLDVTVTIYPDVAAAGAAYGAGPVVRFTDFNNMVWTTLEFNVGGTATAKIRNNVAGVQSTLATVTTLPNSYAAGVAWKCRLQAEGSTIRAKMWPLASTEPTAWTVTTTENSNQGTGVGMYIARFLSNTNSGTANLIGIDDFQVIGFEFTGSVVSWPLQWDMTGRNSWVPITAGGILRRLRQGTNPVQSPLRRQLGGTANVTGYWPMEEGADAAYFTAVGPAGTGPGSFALVQPASDSTLDGGGPAPALTDDAGSITFTAKTANNGTGMAGMFLLKLPSLPSTKTLIARFRMNRGPAPIVDLSVDSGTTYIEIKDATLTTVASATNLIAEDWTDWIAWQLETDYTITPGSTVYSAIYHAVGKTTYWAQTATLTGGLNTNVGSLRLSGPNGTAFAHAWLGQNTLPFVTNTFSLVSSGYAGETAAARFGRVCGEAGIPAFVPTAYASEAMGAQKEGTTMAILQACADADFGAMTERSSGLEFIPRAARWNATTMMALSVSAGQIADIPQPVRDDQKLRNKWTVSRVGGSSAVYENAASELLNGTMEDSATLNVFDDSVLTAHAAWRVYVGTTARMRWPSIPLDFARNPSLIPLWRKRVYGWKLAITTGLVQMSGNEPQVVVEGFQASLTPELWSVNLNASNASIWAAAVTDDTGILGRVDMDAGQCTLTSALTATATGAVLAITTATGYTKWDNTSTLWSGGVDLNVGGERVTVNALSNGTGQAQTFTITARGVNGYAFAHAIGTTVSLWYPATVAL